MALKRSTTFANCKTPYKIMKNILEYLVKNIVEKPDEVKVEEEKEPQGTILKLTVSKEDIAKVIGKNGKIIKSLRTILRIPALKNSENIYIQISE